ncbi:hypothetical protein IKE07_01965 [Candidatus Saccharibacteria bacterium]|nr:hypothetical protein [Candidatus Saccharibacteria bacterium]
MSSNEKSTNTPVIVLLVVLIVAVLGIGGYFIIKDITGGNDNNNSSSSSSSQSSTTPSGDNGGSNSGESSSDSSSDQPVSTDIEAGITYAERRSANFHVEVQTNGALAGTCEFTLTPVNGGSVHRADGALVEQNKVSICSDDVSIKGLNPGDHKLTVIVRAADGRTKTLEQVVNIQ